MSVAKVIYNRDLFTNICSYIDTKTMLSIISSLRGLMHYNHACPSYNTLLYGQVQSGKTSKIMKYIEYFNITKIKVLVIQNSLSMLSQYQNALKNAKISFKVISKNNSENIYTNERVLIVLHNKFRMKALSMFMSKNKVQNYSLVMDESDQYYNKILKQKIYKDAKHVLHVTATPFVYKNLNIFHNIVNTKQNDNYIGIHKIDIVSVPVCKGDGSAFAVKLNKTKTIVSDFLKEPTGMMLINWANFVNDMGYIGDSLSNITADVPIIVLSTITKIYYKNQTTKLIKIKNIQAIIDEFNSASHIIIIANRYSNRGFNYTNKDYTRFITHQISFRNNNITNFIQKCRILGNRPPNNNTTPKLYCMTFKEDNYISKLRDKIDQITNDIFTSEMDEPPPPKPKIITLKSVMVNMCRENRIKGYSKLNKQGVFELLKRNNIDVV